MPSSSSAESSPWAPGERPSFAASASCGESAPPSVEAWEEASALRFATRGCFVRVEFGDDPRVPLRDHPPLELHRRCELTRILRPLLGHKAESFYRLEIGQPGIHFLDQRIIELHHAFVLQ